jgi:hypothetical protein
MHYCAASEVGNNPTLELSTTPQLNAFEAKAHHRRCAREGVNKEPIIIMNYLVNDCNLTPGNSDEVKIRLDFTASHRHELLALQIFALM